MDNWIINWVSAHHINLSLGGGATLSFLGLFSFNQWMSVLGLGLAILTWYTNRRWQKRRFELDAEMARREMKIKEDRWQQEKNALTNEGGQG